MSEDKSPSHGRNLPVNPNKTAAEDLSKKILGSLKSFAGEETQRWIMNLDDLEVKHEKGIAVTDKVQDITSINLIDRLFDDFQRYAFEFNKNSPTEPFIQCERPVAIKTNASNKWSYGDSPILCQGHLVTKSWAMILQAQKERIGAYVVPTEHYFGFNPRSYKSFLDIEARQEDGKVHWAIDDELLTFQKLPALSKKLFAFIVKVEKGESEPTERFTLRSTTGEQAFQLPPKPAQSEEFALLTPDMELGASPPTHARTGKPKEERGHGRAKTAQGRNPLEQNLNAVRSVLTDFTQAIDDELDKVTQLGVQAMQSQDLVVVQKVMRRTATLKSFKDRMKSMLEEWNSLGRS